jgi:Tfp pilus assembly protein PilZ
MKDSPESNDESKLTARLKELLEDVSPYLDCASKDEKRRLLDLLEDLQARDAREHSRKSCSIEVTYTTQDEVCTDFIKNISTGGLYIDTPAAFAAGEEITLTFAAPGQEGPIKVTGEIVWNVPGGLGVRFRKPPGKDLEKVIESL